MSIQPEQPIGADEPLSAEALRGQHVSRRWPDEETARLLDESREISERAAIDRAREHYPWIPAWGKLLGLSQVDVLEQQLRAEREGAPITALSRFETAGNERWAVLDDVTSLETRLFLVDWADAYHLVFPFDVLRHWLDPHYVPPTILSIGAF